MISALASKNGLNQKNDGSIILNRGYLTQQVPLFFDLTYFRAEIKKKSFNHKTKGKKNHIYYHNLCILEHKIIKRHLLLLSPKIAYSLII